MSPFLYDFECCSIKTTCFQTSTALKFVLVRTQFHQGGIKCHHLIVILEYLIYTSTERSSQSWIVLLTEEWIARR
jgi:hypothetical protein